MISGICHGVNTTVMTDLRLLMWSDLEFGRDAGKSLSSTNMSHPDSRHSWEIPVFSFLDLQRMGDKLQNKHVINQE